MQYNNSSTIHDQTKHNSNVPKKKTLKEKKENRLILTLSGAAAENGGSGIWQIHYH